MMWPSRWAELVAQVAEISGERATFIREEMSLTECYQFQQIWFAKNNLWACRPEHQEAVDAEAFLR